MTEVVDVEAHMAPWGKMKERYHTVATNFNKQPRAPANASPCCAPDGVGWADLGFSFHPGGGAEGLQAQGYPPQACAEARHAA